MQLHKHAHRIFRLLVSFAALVVSAALAGCGGFPATIPISPPPTPPTGPTINTGPAQKVYVLQQPTSGNGLILEFPATSSGAVSPSAMLSTQSKIEQIATDKFGDVYIFNGSLVEYTVTSAGTLTQTREITSGTASRICCVDGMAVSPDGAIVIGQDNGEVDEWSSTANGAVAPERFLLGYSEIGGGASPVVVANQIAVDSSDNLYVGAAGGPGVPEVVVFGASASGNAAPARTLGPDGLAGGLTVDASGNVYVTGENCTFSGPTETCEGVISVYAATATGSSAPTRVISGASTLLGTLGGIRVDAVGNLYVLSTDPTGASPTVLKFSATATGNTPPTSSFTSTAWTTPGFNPSIAIY